MEKQNQQILKVYQTDFSPSKGNALQACIASVFKRELTQIPNFIEDKQGYQEGLRQFLMNENMAPLKIPMNKEGKFENDFHLEEGVICLMRGKSPRGDFAHVIVGIVEASGTFPIPLFDPHPDGTFLDGFKDGKGWALFFCCQEYNEIMIEYIQLNKQQPYFQKL